jgi:hypothetical protein
MNAEAGLPATMSSGPKLRASPKAVRRIDAEQLATVSTLMYGIF